MNKVVTEIAAIAWISFVMFFLGYHFGKKKGTKGFIKLVQNEVNKSAFYENQVKKQAAQIQKIQDRLVYMSIGEIEEFLSFMKDDSDEGFGADDDYPVLCIVNPLKEEANLTTEE